LHDDDDEGNDVRSAKRHLTSWARSLTSCYNTPSDSRPHRQRDKDRSIVFARWCQSAPPLKHHFFGPHESTLQTACRALHPFCRAYSYAQPHKKSYALLFNGPDVPQKSQICRRDLDTFNKYSLGPTIVDTPKLLIAVEPTLPSSH